MRYSWDSIFLSIKINSYYYLSDKRFKIHPSFYPAIDFSIDSDLSETKIHIDENVGARRNFRIRVARDGQLSIGKNCYFNNNCSINCLGTIEIGDGGQFGENVLMYDHNHRYSDKNGAVADQAYSIGKIKIGNNCWIGSNTVILKDVEIGDNVVIGAGCVIHKSIAPGTIVVNNQNFTVKPIVYK